MIILYCLLTTLNTNQIPLNKQLKTTQFWDREVRLIKKKKNTRSFMVQAVLCILARTYMYRHQYTTNLKKCCMKI